MLFFCELYVIRDELALLGRTPAILGPRPVLAMSSRRHARGGRAVQCAWPAISYIYRSAIEPALPFRAPI